MTFTPTLSGNILIGMYLHAGQLEFCAMPLVSLSVPGGAFGEPRPGRLPGRR
jgi:hypothetical protein